MAASGRAVNPLNPGRLLLCNFTRLLMTGRKWRAPNVQAEAFVQRAELAQTETNTTKRRASEIDARVRFVCAPGRLNQERLRRKRVVPKLIVSGLTGNMQNETERNRNKRRERNF